MNTDPVPEIIRYTNYYRPRVCAVPFVVWFRERSGSSFLCSILNSHNDIFCRHEDYDVVRVNEDERDKYSFGFKRLFFNRQLKSFDGQILNPTDDQTITHFRKFYSQPKHACGFKFKFDIQVACYPEVVDELHWMSRHLRVIHLTRKNLLKQAVSRQNMERVKVYKQHSNLMAKSDLPPLRLDIPRALEYCRCLQADEARFEKSVSSFDNVLSVLYEDLLDDPQSQITRVLEFLDRKPTDELKSKFHKATPDCLAQAVTNYDALCEAVTGTTMEQYLD